MSDPIVTDAEPTKPARSKRKWGLWLGGGFGALIVIGFLAPRPPSAANGAAKTFGKWTTKLAASQAADDKAAGASPEQAAFHQDVVKLLANLTDCEAPDGMANADDLQRALERGDRIKTQALARQDMALCQRATARISANNFNDVGGDVAKRLNAIKDGDCYSAVDHFRLSYFSVGLLAQGQASFGQEANGQRAAGEADYKECLKQIGDTAHEAGLVAGSVRSSIHSTAPDGAAHGPDYDIERADAGQAAQSAAPAPQYAPEPQGAGTRPDPPQSGPFRDSTPSEPPN